MKIVEILGNTIDNLDRQIIKILGMGTDDVQEINQTAPFGIDSVPIKDMRGVLAGTASNGDALVIGYINKNAIAEAGETRLFSTDDDGQLQIALHLKKDGTMEIGGDSDFMVRFSALETAYNELQGKWNAFALAYVPGSPATVGLPPTLPQSTGDISAAKIDEIKTI